MRKPNSPALILGLQECSKHLVFQTLEVHKKTPKHVLQITWVTCLPVGQWCSIAGELRATSNSSRAGARKRTCVLTSHVEVQICSLWLNKA